VSRAVSAKAKEVRWDAELLAAVERDLAVIPDAARRSMFGFPAFFASGKMFACVYQEEVGMRLPGELALRLKGEERYRDFCPMGHAAMREWVALDRGQALGGTRLGELLGVAADYARVNAKAAKKAKGAAAKGPKKTGRRTTERKVRA
jgi:hypothetical protein